MTVKSVREASINNEGTPIEILPSDIIEITLKGPTTPLEIERDFDYDFPQQNVYNGSYDYESISDFGRSEASGEIQLRAGSGLVFVEKDGDKPTSNQLFNALNEVINTGTKIHETLIINSARIWDFIEYDNNPNDIKIMSASGEVTSISDLDKEYGEIRKNYPIEYADIELQYLGERIPVVFSSNHNLTIDHSGKDERAYVVQLFEQCLFGD